MSDPADPVAVDSNPPPAAPHEGTTEKEMAVAPTCAQCGAGRVGDSDYCPDCGFIYAAAAAGPATATVPEGLIGERYRLTALIGERGGVARFRGEDVGNPIDPMPVVVVRQAAPAPVAAAASEEPAAGAPPEPGLDFELPATDDPVTGDLPNPAEPAAWPGVAWEQGLLLRAAHLSLPRLIDSFTEDGFTYLVEEVPRGTPLWDAWDRDGVTNRERFTWLIQLAQAVERLHVAGAVLEGLRPEMVVVSPGGIAILADLTDLLPLPLPADVPLRGGYSTAPELLLNPAGADERADLYAFGALMYALLLGRELSDLDFTMTGMPRSFLERVPDANPFLARVMAKTFVREPSERFPTDDAAETDRTGFRELLLALDACRRNLDRVKIDLACWSTTGMVRTGNEDGVYVQHVSEARLDDSDEAALILLADGMGGMESGEVAAALALQTLRERLAADPPFAAPPPPPPPEPAPEPIDRTEFPTIMVEEVPPVPVPDAPADREATDRSPEAHGERVVGALREANRRVFETSRANPGTRGMGCTAEVVLIDGGQAVIGHVGDSRVYRMRRGKLIQLTKDHTLVSRLIEQGLLTEKEAETHPRRSELSQAVGGRPEVYPDVLVLTVEPGDWLLVCSDGLSNQVPLEAMQTALRESKTAERAARRLVNTALAAGALDNVTVAVAHFA